jgi:serine/threonine protein kinase/Tfp pilus assembly protein PilF
MNPGRWQQIERVYHAALHIGPDRRSAYLEDVCAGDEGLRREVESLLSYDEAAECFIEEPAIQVSARQMAEERSARFIGQQIGSHRIVSRLGAGGMGEVYLAEDATLDRKVAIKFLSVDSQTDEKASERLIREARAAAQLDHPNVCAIFEVGRFQEQSFIVMQYVEGETLASRIKRGPFEPAESLDIAIQICGALREAHSHGIIHRDIKPQNIMVTARGQVKVLDFGLAKLEQNEMSAPPEAKMEAMLTQPGTVPGTLPYMSPEQLRGEALDARSDIFSLGVVLYEMLTERRPFEADAPAEAINSIFEDEPPSLPESTAHAQEMQPIVGKCLEKNRELRYLSARDLEDDLTGVLRAIKPDYMTTKRIAAGSKSFARRLRWSLVAAGSLLIVAVVSMLFMRRPGAAVDSLAVLPFMTDAAEPNLEYLGEGIPERIINKLSELQNLKVVARASSFKFRSGDVETQLVGQKLAVRAVLSGRVSRRGDNLVISAELVDVKDNRHLWGEQYEVRESNLLGLEERISQTISEKLRLRLTGPEKERLARRATINPEAYQLYLKGRAYFGKLTPDSIQKALSQFQQAVHKDPAYALAYVGMADCYSHSGKSAEARSAVTEALGLDDSLGEAHASLGVVKWIYDWDWKGAEAEYRRGIELNPNSPFAHHRYALLLGTSGRHDEAIREARRAQEIDPVSPDISVASAQAYVLAHNYDEAEQDLKKTLDMEPGFQTALGLLAVVYDRTGRYREAVEEYQQIIKRNANIPLVRANITLQVARVYARWGNRADALRILKEISGRPDVLPYSVAQVYAALEERQHALEWLDKAYETRDASLLNLKTDQTFESFQREPRFVEVMSRVGLEP